MLSDVASYHVTDPAVVTRHLAHCIFMKFDIKGCALKVLEGFNFGPSQSGSRDKSV
jgi:hypothetical protein